MRHGNEKSKPLNTLSPITQGLPSLVGKVKNNNKVIVPPAPPSSPFSPVLGYQYGEILLHKKGVVAPRFINCLRQPLYLCKPMS